MADAFELEILKLQAALTQLDIERNVILRQLQEMEQQKTGVQKVPSTITRESESIQKIKLFRRLFQGRTDVFPKRWDNTRTGKSGYSPVCGNEWVQGICEKPRVKCSECPHQAFLPVTDAVIQKHLLGIEDCIIGVYPLLQNETCWFLAIDFDKQTWQRDIAAFRDTCRLKSVPVAIERSRSGNGAHAWIFFEEAIPASKARRLGSLLITETMERCPDIGFESYDRLFPSQDTLPVGGFGNLIVLPFQYEPRQQGNSVFVDDAFIPIEDQWAFLSGIKRLMQSKVVLLIEEASQNGQILGVRMPIEEDEQPWMLNTTKLNQKIVVTGTLPEKVAITLSNQIYIEKENLSASLRNRLIRLAAFQNPEFYVAQKMRLSTFGKPRIIACAEDFPKHIGLPRGCIQEMKLLFKTLGIRIQLEDKRFQGNLLNTKFRGVLTQEQQAVTHTFLKEETGVLAATTAFGKTVIAAWLIAARGVNTLILVHRRQLLDQWVAQLQNFLDIPPSEIGIIGAGKRKPTGIIDVALIQSLVSRGEVMDCVQNYGQLVVDECHHISASSFEAVVRQCRAKYVLGLTATAIRKDGHQPIIFMQCGPIRYQVNAKKQARERPFSHRAIVKYTNFQLKQPEAIRTPIQQVYSALAADFDRNEIICRDIRDALSAGRTPVVLSERREHIILLSKFFEDTVKHLFVLHGGMKEKLRKATIDQLHQVPEDESRIIFATGRYLGEGFDDARLDTLFLTMPIAWKGTLAQYAGRLHRLYHSKTEVQIYDYVDQIVPMLVKMSEKRMKGYKDLGYEIDKP